MKKYNRRKFLLFASKIGGLAMLSSTGCLPQSESSSNSDSSSNSNTIDKEVVDLKNETLKLLKEGKKITLSWDCGGDQAIISTYIDNQLTDFENAYAEKLDLYLINYLHLPDVGEFSMNGKGEIIEESGEIYIEYESIMKGYMNYDVERDSSYWIDVNTREETWSGTKELFINKSE